MRPRSPLRHLFEASEEAIAAGYVQLKAAGYTAIRTAPNPPSAAFLDFVAVAIRGVSSARSFGSVGVYVLEAPVAISIISRVILAWRTLL